MPIMDTLKNALAKRERELKNNKSNNKKPINSKWEEADEFAKYVGLSTPFVLRLIKIYGPGKVYALRSWLKDAPHDPARYAGLVVWKLKQLS